MKKLTDFESYVKHRRPALKGIYLELASEIWHAAVLRRNVQVKKAIDEMRDICDRGCYEFDDMKEGEIKRADHPSKYICAGCLKRTLGVEIDG